MSKRSNFHLPKIYVPHFERQKTNQKHTMYIVIDTSKDRDVVQIKGFCISCKIFSWDF